MAVKEDCTLPIAVTPELKAAADALEAGSKTTPTAVVVNRLKALMESFGGTGSGRTGQGSAEQLFDKEATKDELKATGQSIIGNGGFGADPETGPMTVRVDLVARSGDDVSIFSSIVDGTGKVVGNVDRKIEFTPTRDGGMYSAEHLSMTLDEDMRGKGFATDFNKHMEAWYGRNGISAVTLEAASNDTQQGGSVVWAKAGYDFNGDSENHADQMRSLAGEFRSATTPEDRAMRERLLGMAKDAEGGMGMRADAPKPIDVLATPMGQNAMAATNWDGVKYLTPEGTGQIAAAIETWEDRFKFLSKIARRWDHEFEEEASLTPDASSTATAAVELGGEGSGRRPEGSGTPGTLGAALAANPDLVSFPVAGTGGGTTVEGLFSEQAIAASVASTEQFMSMVDPANAADLAAQMSRTAEWNGELWQQSALDAKVAVNEKVGAAMAADPAFQEWVSAGGQQTVAEVVASESVPGSSTNDEANQILESGEASVEQIGAMAAQYFTDGWARGSGPVVAMVQTEAGHLIKGTERDTSRDVRQEGKGALPARYSMGPAAAAYSQAVYADTQRTLAEAGVRSVTMTRGFTGLNEPKVGVTPSADQPTQTNMPVSTNALSSWSTDLETATRFSGISANVLDPEPYQWPMTFTSEIPAERIFSFAGTGPGCLIESEYVVIGGDRFQSTMVPVVDPADPQNFWDKDLESALVATGPLFTLRLDEPAANSMWIIHTDDTLDGIKAVTSIPNPRDEVTQMAASTKEEVAALIGKRLRRFGGEGSGRKGNAEKIVEIKGGHVSSAAANKDAAGNYTPERQALHAEIIASFVDQVPKAEGTPEVVFMGGGPASGKGTVVEAGLSNIPSTANNEAVNVNPDDVRAMLPEYAGLAAAHDKAGAAWTHEESSYLAQEVMRAAVEKGTHIVADGTGDKSVENMMGRINGARDKGYDVRAVYVTVPTNEAVKRADGRGKASGRYVPESIVRSTHIGVSQVMPKLIDEFSRIELYDNSGKTPVLVMAGGTGKDTIIADQSKWDDFLAKADESPNG